MAVRHAITLSSFSQKSSQASLMYGRSTSRGRRLWSFGRRWGPTECRGASWRKTCRTARFGHWGFSLRCSNHPRAEPLRVPFVGIEEPEVALHPGAAGVLRDALRAASANTQVAVTSHSPDLLDDKDVTDDSILVVVSRNGETVIGPMDDAGRSAIRDRLYTAGQLLRLNQLEPDLTPSTPAAIAPRLFSDHNP